MCRILSIIKALSETKTSLRPGGATSFSILGESDDVIMKRGRWSSEAYKLYIRDHPHLMSHKDQRKFMSVMKKLL